jgi:hypothetical protein
MNKEIIEFKKERDLSSIITDAFKFIRLEGKQFFLTILKTALIPIVIAAIAMIYYMTTMSSFNPNDSSNIISTLLSVLVMMIAYLAAFIFINLAGMNYIKSYVDNKGIINKDDISKNTKEKFWSFTGFGILSALIFFASAMLCFLPVFYTWTVLSLGGSILVFENETAGATIGKCFTFIKGHFWETFGVLSVIGILVSILGYIFSIPAVIYQLLQTGVGNVNTDPTQVFSLFKDPIYLILNLIALIGQLAFYAITIVANVFIYFDINEQKNATGTIEKIQNLGS